MRKLFLSDEEIRDNLFPFTLTRSAADIRVGILTIREKWEAYLNTPVLLKEEGENLPADANILSANIIPSHEFAASLFVDGRVAGNPLWNHVKILQHPWHIFAYNDWAIREDFKLITAGRTSLPVPESVRTVKPEAIFIEEGAKLSHCIINASTGPVYIGRGAEVMEGACIRGPVAICEGAVVKMGATIYGATTIGPYSMAGGEIKNSVMFAYSNKAHEGYLGDSVIGAWCNLGAGTSNSNVKNNASEVKMYSHTHKDYINTGVSKCGVVMGDYSRSAINTAFNTGTTVGVCANVFGDGLTPKFIPSFSWGMEGFIRYEFEKAIEDAGKWMRLKGHQLTLSGEKRLKRIFDET